MARKKRTPLSAGSADRYVLYTDSVQAPDSEIDFFRKVYRKAFGRPPTVVREDFCGTAAICCQWVRANARNVAIGVDLDPEPLDWCREHYLPTLTPEQRSRLSLRRANVLNVRTQPVDVIAALNFSFCIFKQRSELLRYLRRCHKALARNGVMVMDIYGGPEAQQPVEEKTRHKGFTYVWDQAEYNPITNEALNHIHFHFPDGSRMRNAFTYDWRLWTPAELTDMLHEAGFSQPRVYWEGATTDGEGDGIFRPRTRVAQEDAWVAYVVGFK